MYIREKWQTLWDEFPNNSSIIFSLLLHWENIIILVKIVLARAPIGHAYITYSYLLKGDPMPECIPCYCALTVKHILIKCVNFME